LVEAVDDLYNDHFGAKGVEKTKKPRTVKKISCT
jgi:hypothetical protein